MAVQRIGEIELYFEERGSGPPLLLVHGFPLDHHMWAGQLAGLDDAFRVIAPDLRGFGRSSLGSEERIPMEQFADDLAELLDALGIDEPITFAGLSMGGYVGWQFWRRHPERLHRLVMCDTRAVPDAPEMRQNRLETAARVLREGAGVVADTMLGKLFATATRDGQPELLQATHAVMSGTSPRAIAAALRGMADRADATPWLGQIQVPTLLVCGHEDEISRVDEMRGIAQAMPRAELVVVAEAGHMAPLEQPAAVNTAIRRFLTHPRTETE